MLMLIEEWIIKPRINFTIQLKRFFLPSKLCCTCNTCNLICTTVS